MVVGSVIVVNRDGDVRLGAGKRWDGGDLLDDDDDNYCRRPLSL